MGDPTGTIGLQDSGSDPDLNAIYQGGANFLARMQAMATMRDDAEAALAQLKLGNDLKAAAADAKAKQAAAAQALTDARDVLTKARADAAALVSGAQGQVSAIIADANAQSASVGAAAQQTKAVADAYAASTKKNADDVLMAAKAAQAEASTALASAKSSEAKYTVALNEAKTSKAAADKTVADFSGRIERLNSFLAELVK